MGETLTTADVIQRLRIAVAATGSAAAWARIHGMQPSYVGDVLHGRRLPGPGILRPLGLRAELVYRLIDEEEMHG